MNTGELMLLILGGLGVVFLIIGLIVKNVLTRKLDRCTIKTVGEIVGYNSGANGISVPVVEYEVNGRHYKGKLIYRAVFRKKSFHYTESEVTSHKFDQSLHIKQNSLISLNFMQKLFPMGSPLDVYYNGEKPKENYVQRRPKSLMPAIIMGTGLLYIGLGLLLFFLLRNQ